MRIKVLLEGDSTPEELYLRLEPPDEKHKHARLVAYDAQDNVLKDGYLVVLYKGYQIRLVEHVEDNLELELTSNRELRVKE